MMSKGFTIRFTPDLLVDERFGFSRSHSTMSAMLHSANYWLVNMDQSSFKFSIAIVKKQRNVKAIENYRESITA